MNGAHRQAVIFEFPGTLGSLQLPGQGEQRLRFHAYSESRAAVAELATKADLGAVTFIKQIDKPAVGQALQSADLAVFFDENLSNALPASPTLLALTAVFPDNSVFVSHAASSRWLAREAGLRVAHEISLLPAVLDGEVLTYVRVHKEAAEDSATEDLDKVKGFEILHRTGNAHPKLYGIAATSAITQIEALGYDVGRLCSPEDSAVSTLFLITSGVDRAFLELVKQLPFAEPTTDGLIIAIPGNRSPEEFHPPNGAHGHTLNLLPAGWRRRETTLPVLPVTARELKPDEVDVLQAAITCAAIDREVAPLIGEKALDVPDSPIISSRAYSSPENGLAALHIANRLAKILGVPINQTVINKEGLLNVGAELPGKSTREVVVIGAHLDSVALNLGPKVKAGSIAPGADDDASGVAGVLAAAAALRQLAETQPPNRSIRFVLFNEEEVGMTGSRHYTSEIEADGVSVIAMLQMDMIGYHRNGTFPRPFEVHAPGTTDYTNKDLITQSTILRRIVVTAAGVVAANTLRPQLYPEDNCSSDLGRFSSDHHQFLLDHWPACLIAEDFWIENVCGDDGTTKIHEHPGYHKKEDTYVCCDYAADIARVVAAAAWMIANG